MPDADQSCCLPKYQEFLLRYHQLENDGESTHCRIMLALCLKVMHKDRILQSDNPGVCAVVVSFHPTESLVELINKILPQVDWLILVDNTSNSEGSSILNCVAQISRCEVLRNPINLGLAAALNQGAKSAILRGFEWILTLDQDTGPSEEMVRKLRRAYSEASANLKVALVGSDYSKRAQQRRLTKRFSSDLEWEECKVVITSGTLLSSSAYEIIGPFREDLFIDHVDTEYCLRARLKGYKVIAVREKVMNHSIGTPTIHRLGFMYISTSNHPASRRYFMSRNLIKLLRQYLVQEFNYMGLLLWIWLKSMFIMLLFEDERRSKLRATWAGLIDGWRSRPKYLDN